MKIKKLLNSCSSLLFLCSIAYSSTGSAVTVTSGSLSPLLFDTVVDINKNEYCETPVLNKCKVTGIGPITGAETASSFISIVVGGVSLEVPNFPDTVASSYTSGEVIFKAPFTYQDADNTDEFVNQALITGTITSTGQVFSAHWGAHALFAIRAEVIDMSTNEIVGGADIMGEDCTTEINAFLDLNPIPSTCLNHFNNTIPVSFLVSLREGHDYQLRISSSCETRFPYFGAGAIAFPLGPYNRIAQCTGQVEPLLDFTDPVVVTTAEQFSLYVGPDIEGYLADMIAKLNNLDTTVSSRASQASLTAAAAKILTRLQTQQTELIAKLDGIKGQLTDHDTSIKGQLQVLEAKLEALIIANGEKTEEVIRLVKTPEGQRRK